MGSLVRYKVVDKSGRVHFARDMRELVKVARDIEHELGASDLEVTPEIFLEGIDGLPDGKMPPNAKRV